ncbi:uncharacterized protein LOC143373333 [Andrena cerasifolii]|uniref:uncharacterized protein LOC143373333 n=1 Tax=Andrena cerasifolii TaxID=2819439 RepID=UPI0040380652
MKKSSRSSLVISLFLLCFVSPLQSDPQWAYLTKPAVHDPPDHRSLPLQAFPDQYSAPSVQRPSSDAVPYEAEPFTIYQSKYYENQPPEPPRRVPEAKHAQEKGRYDHRYFVPSEQESLVEERVNVREREDTESDAKEEEMREKMSVLDKILSEDSSNVYANSVEDKIMSEETKRVARQIRKQKPGFFWTLAKVTFQTFNDTKSAIQQISSIINNNIMPDSATQSSVTSNSLSIVASTSNINTTTVNATGTTTTSPTTTTQAPYILTRSGVQTLIRRNILGLVRLFNIEWKEAWNQSDVNVREFQKDLGNQVGSYLQDNPDAY